MCYSATKNGWIEIGTFQKYFENNFLQHIGEEKPVILIYADTRLILACL